MRPCAIHRLWKHRFPSMTWCRFCLTWELPTLPPLLKSAATLPAPCRKPSVWH